MPLYELVCTAQRFKTASNAALQALLKETATYVSQSGGCVRRVDYHGPQQMYQRVRKDGVWHDTGDLWSMWFDTNPRVLQKLGQRMRADPRVLRWTTLKKGVTLSQVTAALPHEQGKTADGVDAASSLYSSNANFPSTISYPRPDSSVVEPELAARVQRGESSRAQQEELQRQQAQQNAIEKQQRL